GRHGACCAERGRPVAAALAQAHPEETWEVSHIGGDRFAGNLLVLPNGLYYGRLDPGPALAAPGPPRSGGRRLAGPGAFDARLRPLAADLQGDPGEPHPAVRGARSHAAGVSRPRDGYL